MRKIRFMPALLKESARMISGLLPPLHQTSLKAENLRFFGQKTPLFGTNMNTPSALKGCCRRVYGSRTARVGTKRCNARVALIAINEIFA